MENSQDFGVLSCLKLGAFLIPLIYFLSSYQSPIPADQVKPLTEYDHEGGNANASHFFSDCNPSVACQLTFIFLLIEIEGGSPRRQGRGHGGRGMARGRGNNWHNLDSS